jgi:hypothetical protein
MSAYLVEERHIAFLVGAALSRQVIGFGGNRLSYAFKERFISVDAEMADRLGQLLWNENKISVAHRYPGESWSVPQYRHRRAFLDYQPLQVLKACHCYAYQSCEHPGWETSEAKAFIDALERTAVRHLPGYDDAAWGPPTA